MRCYYIEVSRSKYTYESNERFCYCCFTMNKTRFGSDTHTCEPTYMLNAPGCWIECTYMLIRMHLHADWNAPTCWLDCTYIGWLWLKSFRESWVMTRVSTVLFKAEERSKCLLTFCVWPFQSTSRKCFIDGIPYARKRWFSEKLVRQNNTFAPTFCPDWIHFISFSSYLELKRCLPINLWDFRN